ncbi:hypothetical protein DYB26_009178 [Aphanomyces astaci]|uniref:Uncharacterized protein n=1 Tax=Aphanomyces astaci TaxID=112090 RepID=A0A3R6ZCD6_APHAT|nr:hypothetical protein DYB26_009178 [Aphanomyces astaci]
MPRHRTEVRQVSPTHILMRLVGFWSRSFRAHEGFVSSDELAALGGIDVTGIEDDDQKDEYVRRETIRLENADFEREDGSLGAPWRTRSDLPDDIHLLLTSGNRHVVVFTLLTQPEEHQLSQHLCQLLHQRLKQMALRRRCQPTTTRRVSELKTAVQKQLQLQRSNAYKSGVFRNVNLLRTFAAGHELYVGLDDESKLSLAAKPVEAPRGGKPQVPRREGGREGAAKNNGRVGGMTYAIMPKTAEPPANKGCLIAMT